MRRSLLVAALTLSAIAGAGWALQAISLVRPSTAQLELVQTLRRLGDYRASQASVVLNGRAYHASCRQSWDAAARTARVVVDPGVATRARLVAPPGGVTQSGDHLDAGDRLQEGEFELAGCPRPLLDWLSSELVHGATVHFSSAEKGAGMLDRLELHPRTLPLDIYVAPSTRLPVRIALTASRLQGTSIVHYGAPR